MAIEWTQALSVEVKEIDDQHKNFIRIMNELHDSLSSPQIKEILGHVMDELVGYAEFHFATEEKYFDMFHYEERQHHEGLHKDTLASLRNFSEQYKTNGVDIVGELLFFLERWLDEHIMRIDKKYIKCFHEHGLY